MIKATSFFVPVRQKDTADSATLRGTPKENKVKKIVETTLKQIKNEGDKFIRELSQKFDNYSPDNFKLSEEEIIDIINQGTQKK